jgi:hypothetical protein
MINEDLRRWFKEKWVDISRKKNGKHPPCGRGEAKDSKYPKCRPSVRVSSETPETSGEMSKEEKKKAVRQKRTAEAKVSTTGKGRKPVMTSHIKEEMKKLVKKSVGFVKSLNEETKVQQTFNCSMEKTITNQIDSSCFNKKSLVQFINEADELVYVKGFIRPSSNSKLKEGYDIEIVNDETITPIKLDDIISLKYFDDNKIVDYKMLSESKNKPTNPKLWSRAKALAKKKFKVYPSAYANGWAAKWYKKHGGGWTSVNENVDHELNKKQKSKMIEIVQSFIREEIVNAKHAGTMTKKEIKSRDKIAKKVKAKPIKGKDTAENAKYRLATYIELRKRGQEPKGKAPKKGKKKKKDTGK